MPSSSSTPLAARTREPSGSRSARRLRREGAVPGIVYGGGEEPLAFSVDSRELRHALADAGAVLDLQVDGGAGTPVVLKDLVRHPVSGETVHIDLVRVRLDQAIQAQVPLELIGGDDAVGVKGGGVLEQPLREVTVEALPTEIPDVIQHDISEMDVNDTITLAAVRAPEGVTIVTDPETVLATITPPRLQTQSDAEIEQETGIVGEGADEDEAAAEGDGEAPAEGGGESSE